MMENEGPASPKDGFFKKMDAIGLSVTYDDVTLKTGHSKTMPDDVCIKSQFSRNVPLKIPIVSAAMDTVTEHELAIEMAKLGGIGIIHKNMTPKEQAAEVARVKYHLNGLIDKPVVVHEDDTIESILARREVKGYGFHTFPVVNSDNRLVGILSENDFDFCDSISRTAKEVMSSNLFTADEGTTVDQAYLMMTVEKKKVLPLVKGGEVVSMYVYSDVMRIHRGNAQSYNVDGTGQLRVGAAIGVGDSARLELLISEKVDVVVIDTAHGDSGPVIDTLREIKKDYSVDVVVGNISEADSAKRLIEAGADGIKVGQGPGSICTTRVVAGVGCPQVTAVYNCSKEAGRIPICADGGLRYSGHIPIAIGAGAHSVMMGNMLAGTTEAPGEVISLNGRQYKAYRGMGSLGAMESNDGSRERYRQSGKSDLVPEGIEGASTYKGDLEPILAQYVGGLRRGMGYVGAATIEELRANADFQRSSNAGQQESHPHDVLITKEAPNYKER